MIGMPRETLLKTGADSQDVLIAIPERSWKPRVLIGQLSVGRYKIPRGICKVLGLESIAGAIRCDKRCNCSEHSDDVQRFKLYPYVIQSE